MSDVPQWAQSGRQRVEALEERTDFLEEFAGTHLGEHERRLRKLEDRALWMWTGVVGFAAGVLIGVGVML